MEKIITNHKNHNKSVLNNVLLSQQKSIAPLVTFRILFGALMAFGAIRFWYNGWIGRLYIEPKYFFKFYGFEWVEPLGETGMYAIFMVIIVSAICIALGLFYRLMSLVFFLSFTYVELIDVTNYLNHYYLVCLLAFWLLFLPAHRAFSLDVLRKKSLQKATVPAWTINVLILQLTLVYIFAGIAKLNTDWLFHAMPMAIWLPERADFPLLGYFFQFKWVAYIFSWFGAIYDLTIAFFLLYQPTRKWAYIAVLAFHLMTFLLFNIGLFPFIMVFSTLVFFSGEWHEKMLRYFGYVSPSISPLDPLKRELRTLGFEDNLKGLDTIHSTRPTATKIKNKNTVLDSPFRGLRGKIRGKKLKATLITLFFLLQFLIPLRHHLYSGNVLWTEEGYRFSWRVMLVEKFGQATFYIQDGETDRKSEILNGQYLTQFQEKQMCIQPDLILQFAHIIRDRYVREYGFKNPIVTVESYVATNGRMSQQFIDPTVNLAEINDSFAPRKWVLRRGRRGR